ncbi:MAG TPA: hypothetical protein VEX68_05290 [Bryobacteraceae bacterium]|nr:hypothetical protein [Bryobacteraceae bacterium]
MRYIILFLLPCLAFAGWTEFKYGPFEMLSDAGDKEARATLNYLEQLRNAVGIAVGQQDLPSVWPIRIVLVKGKRQTYPELKFGRDAWMAAIDRMNPQTAAGVVDVLLRSWNGHVPPNIRRGLITLYSTLDVDGTRVTLGAPPAAKDRDWSRAHMLAVQPEFSGKLRVLLSNLGKGVDPAVAYKNAFEKTEKEIDLALDQYIENGQYETIPVSGKPISAQRQFQPKEVDDRAAALTLGDLAFANGADPGYDRLNSVEGQGLIALRNKDIEQAKKLLAQSAGAHALVEYAKLLPEGERRPALEKAAAANPKWAEPYRLIAASETHPAQRLAALRQATQLDQNDARTWALLAQTQESAKQMADAAKSWAAAERTTDDFEERERIKQFRAAGERARGEADLAARDEARRKTEQAMTDLKNRALMDIRKAEAKANAGKPVIDDSKLDIYKEAADAKKISGVLVRVDCQGTQATLHVQIGKTVTKLLVADPSGVEIGGGGERAFSCGNQKPARKVDVEYEPTSVKKVIRIAFR